MHDIGLYHSKNSSAWSSFAVFYREQESAFLLLVEFHSSLIIFCESCIKGKPCEWGSQGFNLHSMYMK